MVGQNPDLQAKPIVVYHATIIKDHLGMIVTSKQVGSLFLLEKITKTYIICARIPSLPNE